MVDVNWIVWLMDLCRNVIENLAVQIGNAITHKDYSHQFDALQRTLREHHSNLLYTVPDTVTQGSFVLTKPFSLFAPTTKKTQRADIILVFSPVNEWLQAWNIHCNSYCFPSVYCCWVRCLQAEESRLAQKVLVDVIVRAPILEDPRNLLSFIHYFASYILLFLFFFFFCSRTKKWFKTGTIVLYYRKSSSSSTSGRERSVPTFTFKLPQQPIGSRLLHADVLDQM